MKFVAIGGGSIGRHGEQSDLWDIDREIVRLSGKSNPEVLFIPTANSCPESCFRAFKRNYKALGAVPKVLYLKGEISAEEIRGQICSADIIYVGGGNTLKMMTVWRKYGVDKLLIEAAQSGKVMSGLSAGAICWCKVGNSDSRKYSSGKDLIIKVTGLGLIDILLCPHYDSEPERWDSLKVMMKNTSRLVAIALDNCAALDIVDDKYRIITSKSTATAKRAYWRRGEYVLEELEITNEFKPFSDLSHKPR